MKCNTTIEREAREGCESRREGESGDRPMRWAVHSQSGRVTHISHLSRAQTGLACACICYACKTPLQAVNAGREARYFLQTNARGQFFRHATGHQRDDCLRAAARMAALDLFMRMEEIDLPAPKATRQVVGISGHVFEHTQVGDRVHARVTGRRWIDEQKAQITLDNGKVVLIKLVSDTSVSLDGAFDAVINIQVNDPEVASWTPEQMLAKIELVDDWVCWERHWQDDVLGVHAEKQVKLLAIEALEMAPDDTIELPPGLSSWQKSESLLHYVIKDILREIGRIRVPGLSDRVIKEMPDDRLETILVEIKPTTLVLKDVRLENRLGATVPDVLCTATDLNAGLGTFELLIEVAVTHRVDEIKARKISDAGLACVEVDVGLLNIQGRCTRADLVNAIGLDASNKRWIHLPPFHKKQSLAKQQLDHRASIIQADLDARARREAWAKQTSVQEIGAIYLKALRRHWGSQKTDWRSVKIDHHFMKWSLGDISECLNNKGCAGADAPLMVDRGAVLWCLSKVDTSGLSGRAVDMWGLLKHMDQDVALQPFIGLVTMAAKVYRADYSVQSDQVEALLNVVRASLRRGEEQYARPDGYDLLIEATFPALGDKLHIPEGTLNRVRELRRNHHLQEQEKRRLALEKADRERLADMKKNLAEAERLRTLSLIDKVAQKGWLPRNGLSHSIAQCQGYLRETPIQLGENQRDPLMLVALAHRARDLGVPLKNWLLDLNPTSESDVHQVVIVLRKAWLLDDVGTRRT